MVKERLEEARNSPKGNFYFFLSLLLGGELWRALALFYFLLFVLSCFNIVLLKFQNKMYNNHSLSIVLKGQRE
ncbi:hypothetical protein AEY55_02250 [Helicobacter pylori]|uniref:hypothetical protein n=1 Tax=Helicobacter pylori TaxID=210 RepID=UPI0006993D3E|nr:hypothetical protein AEY55_02250 [Helicobacter pylori]